jgi:hypothetical protein
MEFMQVKYGFAFQWGMLKTRICQLQLIQKDAEQHHNKLLLLDRSMVGDYIFALWNYLLGHISREEMDAYENEFGGSMKELDKVPFLANIGLFVYLYDTPALCKARVEHFRKRDSELGIPLNYYEGIDDIHFFLFVFKLFSDPHRLTVVLNWGQYRDSLTTLSLFQSILDGRIKPPTVQIVPKAYMQAAKDCSHTDASYKFYASEEDMLASFEKIKGEWCFDPLTTSKLHAMVFLPLDLLTISRPKNAASGEYNLTLYRNEFKHLVLYHLAHFEDVKLYKSLD